MARYIKRPKPSFSPLMEQFIPTPSSALASCLPISMANLALMQKTVVYQDRSRLIAMILIIQLTKVHMGTSAHHVPSRIYPIWAIGRVTVGRNIPKHFCLCGFSNVGSGSGLWCRA